MAKTEAMKIHEICLLWAKKHSLSSAVQELAPMAEDSKIQFSADPKETHLCWRNTWKSICFRSIICLEGRAENIRAQNSHKMYS